MYFRTNYYDVGHQWLHYSPEWPEEEADNTCTCTCIYACIQRFVGVKTAPVASGPSVDRFITTKESRRFPEMPALPPLVSSL